MKKLLLSMLLQGAVAAWAQTPQPPSKAIYTRHIPTDTAGTYAGAPRPYAKPALYKGIKKTSQYIKMRDGVLIAIDLYLPANLKPTDKIPAILHQTRYWRAPHIRFPFSLFIDPLKGSLGDFIKAFVAHGYAFINVDVRGSGASFGTQIHPWTPDEVKDGAEVIDWIIKQSWSDGKVGSMGGSYCGTASEFLASTQHPNLKAVVLMYALFDVYEDNAFPGGLHHYWFTDVWGKGNTAMDGNKLPDNYKKYRLFLAGAARVKTKGGRKLFRQAVKQHAGNRSVHDGAVTIDYRDDVPSDGFIPDINTFSPHTVMDKVERANIPVFSYSGWQDGAYQHAAIKRHINLTNPNNKLLIGPWEHGGSFNISPFARAVAGFNHADELLKFFDYHIKGIANGLYDEHKIHYFTMGLEKWQSSTVWPPAYVSPRTWYFSNRSLSANAPTQARIDTIQVDTGFGAGDISRWKAVNGAVKNPYTYFDWTQRSRRLTAFESDVLAQDVEVTGHPIVTLYVGSSELDGSVIVYLEDVDDKGNITNVTEGVFRLSHRAINPTRHIYKDLAIVPNHTHLRSDGQPMPKGQFVELQLDLLPTSYLFKKGHKYRVSIAGADKDHFEILYPNGYQLYLLQSPTQSPRIVLPCK